MRGFEQGRGSVARRARRWGVAAVLMLAVGGALAADPPGTIQTVAGGGAGDGGPATAANLSPPAFAIDGGGNILIADTFNNRIRKVSPDGTITTFAGNGIAGSSGDGGLATLARLFNPLGVAVDGGGNVYIGDTGNHRIRKVSVDGTISTMAGTGTAGFSGDGGAATLARLNFPSGVALDAAGSVFVADQSNHCIRIVTPDGTISTLAGTGAAGFSGDGGAATSARLSAPQAVAVDGGGNTFFADTNNHRIRRVSPDGTIATIAGTGSVGFSGDGGAATSARLNSPRGVGLDAGGNLLIGDTGNHRIRRVAPDGTITTVAGTGVGGFAGDGGPAISATLNQPRGVGTDGAGNLLIADQGNRRLRKVAPDGTITTVAGNGTNRFSGDGGIATEASLSDPAGVAVDGSGNLFIADTTNQRIRRVAADGTIGTVAGNGTFGFSGDGGPATAASFGDPSGVDVDAGGNVLVADTRNNRVRKIAPDGTITTVAGNGFAGAFGDGGPATSASLRFPVGVVVGAGGELFIADSQNNRVRRVAPDGTISTVAGTGIGGFAGDGGPATSARLNFPSAVDVDGGGNLLIADQGNNRLRKVAPDGTISTVAGNGIFGFSGDGGPATAASMRSPCGVAVDADANVYIADRGNNRIRIMAPDGTISTVVSTGAGFAGDGGPAIAARLNFPSGVAVDGAGNLFVADTGNQRIRRVDSEALTASIGAPAAIVQECDDPDGEGSTVNFLFDVTPGTADLLRVHDVTGNRLLLQVSNPVQQQYGVGPVLFPHGASTVRIELLDGATVVASAQFAVQIEDTIAPVLAGCEEQTIELVAPLTPVDAALLGISATDACDPNPIVTLAPGALALGRTSVTATARDATGNTSACVFDVTVVDTTPPVFLVCPDPIERHCEAGGTVVAFDVLANDLSGAVSVTCEDQEGRPVDPSGTPFGVGEHMVTCTATDGGGNSATCAFAVRIIDDEAPVILCPEDVVVGNEAGECFAFVAFEVTATDECDPDAGVTCEAPWGPVQSGDPFPVGTTTVACTARDHSGNESVCSFNITVEDREAPLLSGPSAVTLVTDCCGSPLTVSAASLGISASDNCDTEPALVVAPASVGPGTTPVTVTTTDDDGNASEMTVAVTVLKGPFDVRFQRPLDGNVDNLIQPGRTVPVKIRVYCENIAQTGVSAMIDSVERIDGSGTPVANELVEDSGASNDNGVAMRPADGQYLYNLSTTSWPTAPGARFRVTVRVSAPGHVDTLASVVLKNR